MTTSSVAIDDKDKAEYEELIVTLQTRNLIKMKKEKCTKKIPDIISYIEADGANKNRRALITGIFTSEHFVCLNMSLLKSITGFRKSYLSNYFTEQGYSRPKKCQSDSLASCFPEIIFPSSINKQLILRIKPCSGATKPQYKAIKDQYSDELLKELRIRLVNVLNIGSLRNSKAKELIEIIRDQRYEGIPTSVMAGIPLLSQSFFFTDIRKIYLHAIIERAILEENLYCHMKMKLKSSKCARIQDVICT